MVTVAATVFGYVSLFFLPFGPNFERQGTQQLTLGREGKQHGIASSAVRFTRQLPLLIANN